MSVSSGAALPALLDMTGIIALMLMEQILVDVVLVSMALMALSMVREIVAQDSWAAWALVQPVVHNGKP